MSKALKTTCPRYTACLLRSSLPENLVLGKRTAPDFAQVRWVDQTQSPENTIESFVGQSSMGLLCPPAAFLHSENEACCSLGFPHTHKKHTHTKNSDHISRAVPKHVVRNFGLLGFWFDPQQGFVLVSSEKQTQPKNENQKNKKKHNQNTKTTEMINKSDDISQAVPKHVVCSFFLGFFCGFSNF